MKLEILFEKAVQFWLISACAISLVVSAFVLLPVFVGERIYNAYNAQKQLIKDALCAIFLVALICAAMIFLPILSHP